MPRFFLPDDFSRTADNLLTTPILLRGEDAAHLAISLRARVGERVTVCTPDALEIECVIDHISAQKKEVEVVLLPQSTAPSKAESKTPVTVFQGIPKGKKIDYILQKCTELGADRIVFVQSDFSIPEYLDVQKKLPRLSKIVREAAMQSGRGKIPALSCLPSVDAAIPEILQSTKSFFCYENGGAPLHTVIGGISASLSFFIGPEGGISEREAGLFHAAKIPAVSLGARILRTETAPLAVLSAILYETQK